jgi:predicted RNA-binding Zn ribbon-like protein
MNDGSRALTLHHPDGQVFTFDAGALCLELASATGGEGFRARFEVLHTPADFPRWAAAGRLDLPAHGVDPADVETTGDDLAAVKRLREAVWASAFAVATGSRPGTGDLETVNEIAAGAGVVPQIDPATGQRTWRRPVTGAQLVVEFARDAVATFSEPTVHRIRMCAADACYLIYLDTSRPGRRRWCSMQRCGNRAKATGYRTRRRPGGEE